MEFMNSQFHLSACGFLITDRALTTPLSVATMTSSVRLLTPSQSPSAHFGSRSCMPGCFRILYMTFSPNAAIGLFDLRPLIISSVVFPFWCTLNLFCVGPTDSTIHGMIQCWAPILLLKASHSRSRIVRTSPLQMLTAFSAAPLASDSPFGEFSRVVGFTLAALIALHSCTIEGSESAFRMM